MKSKVKIAPSLLSADFTNLSREIKLCEKGGADMLHLDIMDGQFVPNITFGPLILEHIRKLTELEISTHLMVINPDEYIPKFAELGSDYISFHCEAVPHIHRTLQLIRSFGKKAGLAINPLTPIEYAFEAAEYCDFILLMSVNPGFGGQSFITNFYKRAYALKDFLIRNDLETVEIEVDGGVKIDNAKEIVAVGADILVSGSGIFSGDIVKNIKSMRNIINYNN
jgi:ribulose-phosphate 3-epimerase